MFPLEHGYTLVWEGQPLTTNTRSAQRATSNLQEVLQHIRWHEEQPQPERQQRNVTIKPQPAPPPPTRPLPNSSGPTLTELLNESTQSIRNFMESVFPPEESWYQDSVWYERMLDNLKKTVHFIAWLWILIFVSFLPAVAGYKLLQLWFP